MKVLGNFDYVIYIYIRWVVFNWVKYGKFDGLKYDLGINVVKFVKSFLSVCELGYYKVCF